MTNESSQEAIKEIYKDNFYSLPANRHKRDELIKKILLEQNELDNKKAPPKWGVNKNQATDFFFFAS